MNIPLEGPKSRWEGNIKMNFGELGYKSVNWSCVAQARIPWRTSLYRLFQEEYVLWSE
jgi:hypothetical protein